MHLEIIFILKWSSLWQPTENLFIVLIGYKENYARLQIQASQPKKEVEESLLNSNKQIKIPGTKTKTPAQTT